MRRIEAFGVAGVPEVSGGDDLAALVAGTAAGRDLRDGDILVVSSKVVSKAEKQLVRAAGAAGPDAQREAAVAGQTVRVVAERSTPRGRTRIVESRSGPVLAAAGVDTSNVPAGFVLLLPEDPDASARALRRGLESLTGQRIGVLVSDTAGRAWRDGQTDIAIGAAGFAVLDDLRGMPEPNGRTLEVTVRALADELAALGDLVKGKLDGIPVAVVRGLGELVSRIGPDGDGPGAAVLLRGADQDWFRFGHVEAVRDALGVPPGTRLRGSEVPPPSAPAGGVAERLRSATLVGLAGPALLGGDPADLRFRPDADDVLIRLGGPDPEPPEPPEPVELVALAQRIVTAGAAEGIAVQVAPEPGGGFRLSAAERRPGR